MPRTKRSAQRRSIPNRPKQTINNGGRCDAIDVHGFANLHRHLNTANPTCSCLAAISNMAVQSFCHLVGHSNPAPSPWRKRFFLLAQQCFGATYEPLFLVRSWCFGCQKTKSGFETRLWLLVVSKLNKFISSVEHRYFEECFSHNMYGSEWLLSTVWLPTLFKIASLFVVYHRRKSLPVWNNPVLSKWWQNFHFGVNYSFKVDTVRIHYCRNLPQISGNIYWS